ncbi:MAG: GNAT family acetyltransferase [Anaerostipes sp.]|nr:GNAT family acetyltransferase [Anaerostipes sp.]
MKLLIMCEGPNELEIVRILLRNDLLVFSEDDLLNLVPYHARQIKKSTAVQAALNIYPGEVKILRIGDGLNEKLVVPKEYEEKVKSTIKPKTFVKNNIKYGRKKYNNSTSFYMDYFGSEPEALVMAIRDYKRFA